MFTYICILIAVLLAAFSIKEYRFISLVVALEFALHKLSYNFVFLDFRSENGWLIYIMYALIQLCAMFTLYKLRSHFVIVGLLFINMVYNLSTALGYFYEEFIHIYYIYPYFVGTIMIFELFYLGLLNRYVINYRRKHGRLDFDYIDSVFRVRSWRGNRGLV